MRGQTNHGQLWRWGRAIAIFTVAVVGARRQSSGAEDADKTYSIKLTRAFHVGQTYPFSCKASSKTHNEISVAGQQPVVQDRNFEVETIGTIEVLAVDKNGQATKTVCTVSKCVRADQNPPREVLPAGAIVTSDASAKKTVYTLKDGELTPEQTEVVSLLPSAHRPDEATDDMMFGTDNPQKAGAVWPIDKNKVAETFGKDVVPIKPEDVDGHGTLVAVSKIDGKDYLQVKVELSAKHLKGQIPGGMTMEDSQLDASFGGVFSGDGSEHPKSESMDMKVDVRARGAAANGAAVTMHITAQRHLDVK